MVDHHEHPPGPSHRDTGFATDARGALDVQSYAAACLNRIEAREAVVQAWAFIDPEAGMARARVLDTQPAKSRLHGTLIGIKDVIHTRTCRRATIPRFSRTPARRPTRPVSPCFVKRAPCSPARPRRRSSPRSVDPPPRAIPMIQVERREGLPVDRPPQWPTAMCPSRSEPRRGVRSSARPRSGGVWALKPTWGLVSNEGCKRFSQSSTR